MQQQALQHPPLVMGILSPSPAGDNGLRLRDQCREKVESGFNFVLLPLNRQIPDACQAPLSISDYETLPPAAFTRQAHKALTSQQWHAVVGVVSLPPGMDPDAELATHMIMEAVQWTCYLGLHGMMLTLPVRDTSSRYATAAGAMLARILNATQANGFDIWVRLPCSEDAWQIWNTIRYCIGVVPGRRLHAVLDFKASADVHEAMHYRRWFGESVAAVLLPAAAFRPDVDHRLALPDKQQQLVAGFMQYPGIKWIIESEHGAKPLSPDYRHCLARLQNRTTPSWEEVYLRSSVDQLQSPLQPLADHLASVSYEEFERDAVKYTQYEKAIAQALTERHDADSIVTVMVLGAGRGPIVDAAVRASRSFAGRVRFFVIEKNPSAAITLMHRARDDWGDADVTVIKTDMRRWHTAERADIIVSELLGSWGDNELSPECLDGAQGLLKPGGISIPASYTSYLAPVTTARLHGTIASLIPFGHEELSLRAGFETSYVVRMGAIFQLAAEQACFTFDHPNTTATSNDRHTTCIFELPAQLQHCTVHGFRGTFTCQLYGSHTISIADHDRSAGMFSWSPLYIPVMSPFTVSGGSRLEIQLWRKSAPGKVWYEWMATGHTPLHNPGGRSSTIGTA